MNETSSTSSGATADDRMKLSQPRKKKSPKVNGNGVPQKAPGKNGKKLSATSATFPEGEYFSTPQGLRSYLTEGGDDSNSGLGDDNSLKIPSHDSFFDDHLAYDTTLFVDSDPFHAEMDLFAGLSPTPHTSKHLDSKYFLHEDLSLFGHDCISNFL
jgi:hypothetical protein